MMSDPTHNKNIYSLLEVLEEVRFVLQAEMEAPRWIKAEMNKLNLYRQSGHCYPELLEKRDGKVVAQIRATLWRGDYQRINQHFLEVLKEPLTEGISILFLGKISFDPVYGLALRIMEIDPVFSLGVLEQEKQESIEKLHKEGIFDANKMLDFPLLPKRIAVISAENSKGYADFLKIINQNSWGYRFFHLLFPSLLQGDKLAVSMGEQLRRIEKVQHHFDLVVIIRGGGGEVGLAGYNHFGLAKRIALFPLPVITGIGHATNETVSEMVAFRNCITPTEVGAFLLQQFHNVNVPVQEAQQLIIREGRMVLKTASESLNETGTDLRNATMRYLDQSKKQLRQMASGVKGYTNYNLRGSRQSLSHAVSLIQSYMANHVRITKQQLSGLRTSIEQLGRWHLGNHKKRLEETEKQVQWLDPQRVLARGYSITRKNGQVVRDAREVQEDDLIETTLFHGKMVSKKVKPENKP